MKITVVGCGAIGQLWINALAKTQHRVQGWHNNISPFYLINVIQLDGSHEKITIDVNQTQWIKQTELLLVTVKAHQIAMAITPLLSLLLPSCTIVLLHNGLGVLQQLPDIINPLLLACTTHAVIRQTDRVIHTAAGETWLGPVNQTAQYQQHLANILNATLPPVSWQDDILYFAWQKLAINCVINPLAVKYQCCNGQLTDYQEEITQLCTEIAQVMSACGFHTNHQTLSTRVNTVIALTCKNTCSMLQDIQAHRLTEIDYITGYLLAEAERYAIHVPLNQSLYQLIKNKESDYGLTTSRTLLSG